MTTKNTQPSSGRSQEIHDTIAPQSGQEIELDGRVDAPGSAKPILAPGSVKPAASASLGTTEQSNADLLCERATIALPGGAKRVIQSSIPSGPSIPPYPMDASKLDISYTAAMAEELKTRDSVDTLHSYDSLSFAFRMEDVDDELKAFVLQHAGSMELIDDFNGIWAVTIPGERQTWRFLQIRKEIYKKASALGVANPGFMHWGARVPIQKAQKEAYKQALYAKIQSKKVALMHCDFGNAHPMDKEALRIACEDRNAGYVMPKIVGLFTDDFVLVTLTENITLEPGGAKHLYMRDEEKNYILSAFRTWRETGRPLAITVEGPLQIGKSRLIRDVMNEFHVLFPDTEIVFIPAMDDEKNLPESFFDRYITRLLKGTKHIPLFNQSREFEELTRYVENPSRQNSKRMIPHLAAYFSYFKKAGLYIVIEHDDIQWDDAESQDLFVELLRNTRGFQNVANFFAAREGDEPMPNKVLSAYGIKAENRRHLGALEFLDQAHGEPVPEYRKFVCELLGFDVSRPLPMIGDSALILLAEKSNGNPGYLTGLVKEAKRSKILIAHLDENTVEVNIDALRNMKSAGEADSTLQNEVERFVENPKECAVLAYILIFSEIGNCTSSLLQSIFVRVFQQPELYESYLDMCLNKNIFDRNPDTDVISIRRSERFSEFLRARLAGDYMKQVYERVVKVLHDLRKLSDGKAVISQCSAYNIYRCADKGGRADYKDYYAFDAFNEAYDQKDHKIMLSIYDFIKTQPHLLEKVKTDKEFLQRILEAMYGVLGKYRGTAEKPGEYEALGVDLQKLLSDELQTSTDLTEFHRFCDTMTGLSYWRTFVNAPDGMEGILHWMKQRHEIAQHALSRVQPNPEKEFILLEVYRHYALALLSYLSNQFLPDEVQRGEFFKRHGIGVGDDMTVFGSAVAHFLSLQDYSQFQICVDDPRFIQMRTEILRLSANTCMVKDAFSVEMGDYGALYKDFTAIAIRDAASMQKSPASIQSEMMYRPLIQQDPDSRAFHSMEKAYLQLEQFLALVSAHPDTISQRHARYVGMQGAARSAAMIGSYVKSWQHLSEARSFARNAGDLSRVGEFTVDVGTVIQYLVQNLQLDRRNAELSGELWTEAEQFYAAVSMDYPGVASDSGDIVQGLLEYGDFFLQKGIPMLREHQNLFGAYLGRMVHLENRATLLEHAIAQQHDELPDMNGVIQDMTALHEDFNAFLGATEKASTREHNKKTYWTLYGIPVFAQMAAVLERGARQGNAQCVTWREEMLRGLKFKMDIDVQYGDTWKLDQQGKPIPDPTQDVPKLNKEGGQIVDPRTGLVVLKSHAMSSKTHLPILENGKPIRSSHSYLVERTSMTSERRMVNTLFAQDVLGALQDNFQQSIVDVRHSIPALAVKLATSRDHLMTLLNMLPQHDDEVDAIRKAGL